MENIVVGILLVLGIVFMVLVTKSALDRIKAIPGNIANIEQTLSENGFTVSRKIGKYSKWWGTPHYFLYVDDSSKKWLLTSPFLSEVNPIRDFSELLDYEFFDYDGSDIAGKMARGTLGVIGAIGGVAVGGLTAGRLGGVVGGVVGGRGTAKAVSIMPGMSGESAAYGLMLQTMDCDANNPVLVFDFRETYTKTMDNNGNIADKFLRGFERVTKAGVSRSTSSYRKDIKAIKEMAVVFDYIMSENARRV